MKNLIDKDILENILRRLWKEDDGKNSEHRICYNKALQDVQCEIDSLEVKEVDFEKELDRIWFDNGLGNYFDNDAIKFARIRTFCKHFFEFGLKAAQKGE